MKTLVEKLTKSKTRSFDIREHTLFHEWQNEEELSMRMHPVYEIVVILDGRGKRFIRNHVEYFSKGDIFFIGPNVPHCVQVDPGKKVGALVIHFFDDAFGKGFFDLPENQAIKDLLEDSENGITFKTKTKNKLYLKFHQLLGLQSFEKMVTFLRLLNEMAHIPNRRLLVKGNLIKHVKQTDHEKINRIHLFILEKFQKHISLEEISIHAEMSPATFCRYFKKHFRKTFTKFLNEIRVEHACKVLRETNKNISEVAYSSGYNHLTHFNKQFKRIAGCSPREYIRRIK